MRPVLDKILALVDQFIQAITRVRTQPRVNNQLMCRNKNIDEIELQNSQPVDHTSNVTLIGNSLRSRFIESKRCQRDAACFCDGQRLGSI